MTEISKISMKGDTYILRDYVMTDRLATTQKEVDLLKETVFLLLKRTKKPNKPNYWRYRIPR